jgi:hypothetical protein
MKEIWKPVPNFYGRYFVSSLGRVKNKKTNHVLKQKLNNGYCVVNLFWQGIQTSVSIHQLVAQVFIGPCPKNKEVNHKDEDTTNNRLKNLEYKTHRQNIHHSLRLCGYKRPRKTFMFHRVPF